MATPPKKTPQVDERKKTQQDIAEHKAVYDVLMEGLVCGNEKCGQPVSAAWDACPSCGGSKAIPRKK